MKLDWLTKSISNPNVLLDSKENLAELKKRFPYLSALHTFDAKLEQLESGLDYQDKIKKAAVYSPNRTVLYEYVIQPGIEKAIEKTEQAKSEVREQSTEQTSVSTKPINLESEEQLSAKSILEKEILTHAISSSILKESDVAKSTESEVANTGTPTSKPEVKKEKKIDHSMNVLAWLSTENEGHAPSIDSRLSVKKEDLINNFIQQGEEKIHLPKETTNTFLEINRPQTEFFSPENMAKMSLAENEDFVTETLAGIYAKQGNSKKAISAYEKLSLKFPEKSNYFARLIQKLKEN